ncbi:MAG TPA: AMP-binding protein [Chloroflexota bacterium]|jgi:acyl-CoA synthetase (AMP-forming)/AMP-acid ligase II
MTEDSPSTIHAGALLRRGAARDPRKVAVIWEEGARTYGELLRRVDRLAVGLAAHGVARGDRVGVLFPNGPHFLEAWWAVAALGAVVVPLSTRALPGELTYVLSDAEAVAVLADAALLAPLLDVRREVPSLRLIVGHGERAIPEVVPFEAVAEGPAVAPPAAALSLADPCAIYYTAGTTGVSKGAVRSHLSVTWGLALLAAAIPRDEVYLARAPMYHTGGSLTGPFATLAAGATLVSMRGFDAPALLATIERHHVTRTYVHPTLVANALLEEVARHPYDLASLRYVQWTAGPLPEAVRARLLDAFPGLPFEVTYGMTEVSNIASYPYMGGPLKAASCVGQGPVGTAIRIVDEDDQPVPDGRVGEVAVRSPTAMMGYWRDPARTATVLAGGWVHTGDLGYLDGDGYLHLAGRQKDAIVTGGETVHAVEVENALASLPAVVEAAVVGLPDATWGEAVSAVVVARAGAALTEGAVIAHCRQHLPGHKCPKRVLFVEALPKNAVGKVQKLELVRRYGR